MLRIKRSIKWWYRIAKCLAFHKKKKVMIGMPFVLEGGIYLGCDKCDVWRKVDG